jgi:hypothetical protein
MHAMRALSMCVPWHQSKLVHTAPDPSGLLRHQCSAASASCAQATAFSSRRTWLCYWPARINITSESTTHELCTRMHHQQDISGACAKCTCGATPTPAEDAMVKPAPASQFRSAQSNNNKHNAVFRSITQFSAIADR